LVQAISFEPDPEEFKNLLRQKRDNDTIFKNAIFDCEGEIRLYLTRAPGCSSVFRPNISFLEQFPETERYEVVDQQIVSAITLDSVVSQNAIRDIDFLKIDVQGAELTVLNGATKKLDQHIFGVHVEVEFHEIYLGQPLFPEIHSCLQKNHDPSLYDLRKSHWKYKEGKGNGPDKGQLIFADALYLRSPEGLIDWVTDQSPARRIGKLLKAIVVGLFFGVTNYSHRVLALGSAVNIISQEQQIAMQSIIRDVHRCVRYRGRGRLFFEKMTSLIFRVVQSDHNGWATGERHLGSRKTFGVFH
jgi:FkbM family methyltransferase